MQPFHKIGEMFPDAVYTSNKQFLVVYHLLTPKKRKKQFISIRMECFCCIHLPTNINISEFFQHNRM